MKTTRNRSLKTIRRDNQIHEAYNALIIRGGVFSSAVSRSFIYERLSAMTGYSTRTIADVLNKTTYTKVAEIDEILNA